MPAKLTVRWHDACFDWHASQHRDQPQGAIMFRAIACINLVASTVAASSAHAAWPERTVTIVTPFAPGGIADVVARLTAERLQSSLKQNFVVENVSGAGGTAGPERVAKAVADGYTLMSPPIFQLTTAKYA